MTSSIFGTATSGLLAFQRALSTTGHNIANVNTPGFSRQRVEVGTQIPQASGAGFIGTGVQATSVVRLYDNFLAERVRNTTASTNDLNIYRQYATRIADVLGDNDAGLNGALENFFNAVQGVSNDPSSIPARQLMLSEADSLVSRFQYLDTQISANRKEVNDQLGSLVAEVNSLSESIAAINEDIVVATGRAGGQPPNDLLDERDHLIERLSELVSVQTLNQSDGSINVFIGTGQSLVTGFRAATLSVAGSPFDATEKDILYTVGSVSSVITDNISGGKLGGLLRFREEVLDPAQNGLGRIAAVLGTEFNNQHVLGMDLNGAQGTAFFSLGTPQTSASTANTGSGTVAVNYDSANIGNLTTRDYIMSYNGAAWSLADTDGNPVTMTGLGTLASPFLADGLSIVVGGAPAAGDRFQIRPTRDGGEDIGMLTNNVRNIAAAAPVRISEATNANGVPTNTGSGAIAFNNVTGAFTPLAATINFTFDSALNQFNYSDGGAVVGTIAYNPATDSGTSFTVAGVNFTVTGTPANTDQFNIATNTNGAGDNGNALLLGSLQTALTVENGTTNFQGGYAQLISDMGTKARKADISSTAQLALHRQAKADRDALSGVNLDEEAANLVRFQQAYQAMAQVVTVADSMFQTLLNAVQR